MRTFRKLPCRRPLGANYVNEALHRKVLKRFSQFGTLDVRLIRPPASAGPGGGSGGEGGNAPGQGATPGATATLQPGFIDLIPGGGAGLAPLLPGGSYDFDGDGNPDLGTAVLPLTDADFDLTTNTGTISLGGGFVIDLPGLAGQVSVVNPEVVIGATDDASGLYGGVNGVRVKIGDLDTDALDLNVADGTVMVDGLDVTVSGALRDLLHGILGTDLVQAGAPPLKLDLSFLEL
jgi:hypothetical protein